MIPTFDRATHAALLLGYHFESPPLRAFTELPPELRFPYRIAIRAFRRHVPCCFVLGPDGRPVRQSRVLALPILKGA